MSWLDTIRDWFRPRPPGPTPPPPAPPGEGTPLAPANAVRAAHGKPPLSENLDLSRAAIGHAEYMARTRTMTHQVPGELAVGDRIRVAGYAWGRYGENVAAGQRTVDEVVAAWSNSPGHRANLLGEFADAALAVATGGDGQRYWCLVCASPGGALLAALSATEQAVAAPDQFDEVDDRPGE